MKNQIKPRLVVMENRAVVSVGELRRGMDEIDEREEIYETV